MSTLPENPKGSPIWPTFRGASRNHRKVEMLISVLPGIVYTGLGSQIVRETENGGFHSSGLPHEYPVVSFERRLFPRSVTGPRKPLYLICWIGWYGKGCIMHVGWQFPHDETFEREGLDRGAFQNYADIADIVYDGEKMDSQVKRFLEKGTP